MQLDNMPVNGRTLDRRQYGRIFATYWVTIAVTTLVTLFLGLAAATQQTVTYESTTTLYVSVRTGSSGATGDLLQGSNFAQSAMTSYADVVTTSHVLDQVIDELDLETSASALSLMLDVSSPTETVLLEITATHSDPEVAADIANTTGAVFTRVIENDLEISGDEQNSPVQVRPVDSASPAEQQNGPYYVRNGILGVFLGLILGAGIAVTRALLDTRIHATKSLEQFHGLPVLGRVPETPQIAEKPLIVHDSAQSQRAEAFRMLRTNLRFLSADEDVATYMVSSPMPAEGKTHIVANLAIVLAESGVRVTVVDADLRNPRLAQVMGLEGSAGLSDVLIGRATLNDVLQPWGRHHLNVLSAGQLPPNPSELVGSQSMRRLLGELEKISDYILIDAPPVLPVTDAAVISTRTNGTLLVVALDQTHWRELDQALQTFDNIDGRVLGLISNRDRTVSTSMYSDYTAADAAPQTPTTASRVRV